MSKIGQIITVKGESEKVAGCYGCFFLKPRGGLITKLVIDTKMCVTVAQYLRIITLFIN